MFHPGISGNARGRPMGSVGGRAQALAALDRMLSKECNQQALIDALEKELQADPARFFRNIVVPLLPRSTREAPTPRLIHSRTLELSNFRTSPPLVLEPYVPPPPRPSPPPPGKESSSGPPAFRSPISDLSFPPSGLCPQFPSPSLSLPHDGLCLSTPHSSRSPHFFRLLFVVINSVCPETSAKRTETLDR